MIRKGIFCAAVVALLVWILSPLATDAKVDVAKIMDIQRDLKALDYNCKCTGMMDEATVEAVKQFQKDHGLTVDGMLNPETLDAIKKAWEEKVKHAEHEHP